MRSMLITASLGFVLWATQVMASPRHGHFHKRVVDVVTDWDVVYETVTDVIWVTVTGDDGAVTTTTTPAAVNNAQATTSVAAVSSTAPIISSSVAVASTPAPPAPVSVASSSEVVASSVVASVSSAVAAVSTHAAVLATTSISSVAPVKTTLSTIISAAQTSSAPATIATLTNSGSKRGLSYNEASLLDLFTGSANINWCYNWGATSEGTVPSGMEFVPMLWGLDATDDWNTNAKAAIADGATALLAFNEPDNSGQSNISPADAATAYIKYMNPFSGSAQLGAPAVTNGGSPAGLTWLESFLTACNGECDIDFVPIHWYDSATNYGYFKDYVQQAYVAGGNRTLWITEFGATGSDAEQVTFLETVMPWLDEQEYVGRYAYFMDDVGVLLESATELSDIGTTFMSYTASTVSGLIADAS